ncbi:hypothetical protein [uncultured Streptococcus sp.]|uniref:tetratricopeptide repeat protein n=1 Tax=uncultured Streptococcus sp. TaxID=83427 RepID=UPI003211BB4A
MKHSIKKLTLTQIFLLYRYVMFICFGAILVSALIVTKAHSNKNSELIFILDVTSIILLMIMLSFKKIISNCLVDLLVTDLDLDKYRGYFEYGYKHSIKSQKGANLQESHLANAQYHYFRGEFEQSLQSLNEINLKKARWRRRKVLLTSLSYYRMLNKINQKDFDDFEDSLALYRKMKGKNVPESSAKLLAIYRVVSGQSTDYFERIAPKYKLHQIEAKYYAALNHLNQDQPEEAKACFQEIVNENPDLFYVKEAKKYLGS